MPFGWHYRRHSSHRGPPLHLRHTREQPFYKVLVATLDDHVPTQELSVGIENGVHVADIVGLNQDESGSSFDDVVPAPDSVRLVCASYMLEQEAMSHLEGGGTGSTTASRASSAPLVALSRSIELIECTNGFRMRVGPDHGLRSGPRPNPRGSVGAYQPLSTAKEGNTRGATKKGGTDRIRFATVWVHRAAAGRTERHEKGACGSR